MDHRTREGMNTKTRIASYVLWFAYILALFASVGHVAWAFGTLEQPGNEAAGWIAALAVDMGLAALAYGIQQRKRVGRGARDLWVGVLIFAGISAFANLLHAIASEVSGVIVWASFDTIDPLTLIKAIVLSASLPLLVVYLGEIVSADDARIAQAAIDEADKARKAAELSERRAEKARIREEARAKATLEAEAERAESEQVALDSAFKCVGCDRTFSTQQGLAGHLRFNPTHKANANGTERATERVETR